MVPNILDYYPGVCPKVPPKVFYYPVPPYPNVDLFPIPKENAGFEVPLPNELGV